MENMENNVEKPRRYFTHGELIVSVRHQQRMDSDEIFRRFLSHDVWKNSFNGEGIEVQIEQLDIDDVFKKEAFGIIEQIKESGDNLFNSENITSQQGSDKGFVTSQLALELQGLRHVEPGIVEDDKIILLLAAEVTLQAMRQDKDSWHDYLERNYLNRHRPNLLNLPQQLGNDLQIIGASPNWYFPPAQGGSVITGGPGTKPVPPDSPETVTIGDAQVFIQVPPAIAAKAGISVRPLPANPKKSVDVLARIEKLAHVIVLDTIPPIFPHDEERSEELKSFRYKERARVLEDYKDNELLMALIDKLDGHTYYYPFFDKRESLKLVINKKTKKVIACNDKKKDALDGHDYDMSDHGLFISGLIHQTQPYTKIDLIQVLNNCGVGTLNSLLWGLDKVRALGPDRSRAILNCSLTIGFEESKLREECEELVEKLVELVQKRLMSLDELEKTESYLAEIAFVAGRKLPHVAPFLCMFWPGLLKALTLFIMEYAFTQTQRDVSVIVGAAGNDGTLTPTRYPAAFASVIGIGALDSNDAQAPYSNTADEIPGGGFWTFGGDANNSNSEYADSVTGLLGVYTAPGYPDINTPNKTGWARWAGTSFATAVISGSFALLHSQDKTGNVAKGHLRNSVAEVSINKKETVKVRQGR
ncbi:MAG: S8/S53 family peptidase [Ardenticatenaceae bacterium]|nr:S8/S53 family peptidase [Ardenticatenaceae bacterium]